MQRNVTQKGKLGQTGGRPVLSIGLLITNLARAFAILMTRIRALQSARKTRSELRALSDRQLRDIGLDRRDI
jgi:uncharacterized protein YjiS (DUF1127 family)